MALRSRPTFYVSRFMLHGLAFLIGATSTLAQGKAPIAMDDLHRFGGVPPGWRFTPPAGDAAAGRRAFVDLGCHSCHAVQGEAFAKAENDSAHAGPDLTGMGTHHPPDYFAESILNPNAVRIEGQGYLGADGTSIMPMYPSMTVSQLADLVAYLSSLKGTETGTSAHCAAPARGNATAFFTQAFEVSGDKLDTFYDWFNQQGFRDYPGMVSVQTFAGRRGKDNVVLSLFGFDNEQGLHQFIEALDRQPKNSFLRPSDRYILRGPPLYRVEGMSAR